MVRRCGCCRRRGRLAGRRQQEGERARCRGLQQPELPGLDARVAADLGQIAAHQREVMVAVRGAQAANALQCRGVAHVAAQRIAAVGWIGDQPAARRICAAWRIRRGCGFCGCNSKYWLKRLIYAGSVRDLPATPGPRCPHASRSQFPAAGRLHAGLPAGWHLCGHSGAHGCHGGAGAGRLPALPQGFTDACR